MNFREWYIENQNSDILRDEYENFLSDLKDTEYSLPSFHEWAKDYFDLNFGD